MRDHDTGIDIDAALAVVLSHFTVSEILEALIAEYGLGDVRLELEDPMNVYPTTPHAARHRWLMAMYRCMGGGTLTAAELDIVADRIPGDFERWATEAAGRELTDHETHFTGEVMAAAADLLTVIAVTARQTAESAGHVNLAVGATEPTGSPA